MTNNEKEFIKFLKTRIKFYDESIEKLNSKLEKLERIEINGTKYSYSDRLAQVKASARFDILMKKTEIGKMQSKVEYKNKSMYINVPKTNFKLATSNVDKICQVIDDFIASPNVRYFNKMFGVHELQLLIAHFTKQKNQEQRYLDIKMAIEEEME